MDVKLLLKIPDNKNTQAREGTTNKKRKRYGQENKMLH